jgi:hypothetical protein
MNSHTMPASITYAVRNQSDNSVIEYSSSQRDAERTAAEVRSGDFDGDPRECWVGAVDPDWDAQGG